MLRGMVFIDYLNFDIALHNYYHNLDLHSPKLDYNLLFKNIAKTVRNVDFVKGFIFIPKPDEFLIEDEYLQKNYSWLSGMNNAPYTDVIEGNYYARPKTDSVDMDITDKSTYYKVEKGTDINLAVTICSKAFYNAFDIAFVVSADTDYLPVYRLLKELGKIVVVVTVKDQTVAKIREFVDNTISLDEEFFKKCLRTTRYSH